MASVGGVGLGIGGAFPLIKGWWLVVGGCRHKLGIRPVATLGICLSIH